MLPGLAFFLHDDKCLNVRPCDISSNVTSAFDASILTTVSVHSLS